MPQKIYRQGISRRTSLCLLQIIALLVFGTLPAHTTQAQDVLRIAVAANFKLTLQELVEQFHTHTQEYAHIDIKISSGATGSLYTQIINGAPFDIFFAADETQPVSLVEKKLALHSDRLVYATGELILVTKKTDILKNTAACQKETDREKTATLARLLHNSNKVIIANPRTAPYGHAARQVLNTLSIKRLDAGSVSLIRARNIIHAQQLFEQTDADTALLSQSQALKMQGSPTKKTGSYMYCNIPSTMYTAIRQAAVLIDRQQVPEIIQAAATFMNFVYSEKGKKIITLHGYSV